MRKVPRIVQRLAIVAPREMFMRNDPVFDPIFNSAPLHHNGGATPDQGRFLIDGWSYQPIAAERDEPLVVAADQHR